MFHYRYILWINIDKLDINFNLLDYGRLVPAKSRHCSIDKLGLKLVSNAFIKTDKGAVNHETDLPYDSYSEYLSDEFLKLDMLLEFLSQGKVVEYENNNVLSNNFYVSPEYASSLISGARETDYCNPEILKSIEKKREEIQRRLLATGESALSYPLYRCIHVFVLSELEKLALLVGLAFLKDSKYEKIYSCLQDSLESRYPSVQILYDLFSLSNNGNNDGSSSFIANSSLVYWNLIQLYSNFGGMAASEFFFIEPSAARYLLGDESYAIGNHIYNLEDQSRISVQDLYACESTIRQLRQVSNLLKDAKAFSGSQFILLSGFGEAVKHKSISALAGEAGLPVIHIDTETLLFQTDQMGNHLRKIIRDAILTGSILFFKKPSKALDEKNKYIDFLYLLINEFSLFNIKVFLSIENFRDIPKPIVHQFYNIQYYIPDYKIRKKVWASMAGFHVDLNQKSICEFAGQYRFTEEQIYGAVEYAKKRSFFSLKPGVTQEDLLEGCRVQSNENLLTLGKQLKGSCTLKDIVLPGELYVQISELINHYRYKHQVYDDWGFGKSVAYGRGVTVLTSGPSGTGKTMAASVIGNELKLPVYKIDLSSVISKYIGETEKNLSKIFTEAVTSNSILFFDEADAIFGKRTEVKDSHDRYANIEVSYLLQKMEEYEGITILASNLRQNMDDAFFRRMQFVMEFPFPDANMRRTLWKKIFPDSAPLASDIDYDFLAEKLEVAGGNIKNVAVSAAFIASGENDIIKMRHILLAAKKEYKKLNKSFLKNEFSPYFELIENEVFNLNSEE